MSDQPQGRIVLVESTPGAPGVLGATGWAALAAAPVVHLRDPDTHPSARHLSTAGLSTTAIPVGTLDVRDRRDLLGAGDPGERRLAAGLCDVAEDGEDAVVLLGPGDEHLGRAVGLEAAKRHVEVEWVFLAELPVGGELLRLVEVERRLRDPVDGCPWDLEQDHGTLAPYLVEETYEALDAIAGGDDAEIVEELGDVLLQVVFHAQVGADRRAFTIDDVARGIADKLVRRHPHVFEDVDVEDADEVVANWEQLKAAEKPERDGPFDGVVAAQPAVPLVEKLLSRAAKQAVPVPDAAAAATGVAGQAQALAAGGGDAERGLGDLLFAAVALARALDVDPELALRAAADRYRDQVERAVALADDRGATLADLPLVERIALLGEARRAAG